MNITIVGAGNIGTQIAVHCASKGHKVIIYTSKCDLFSKDLKIVNELGETFLSGEIDCATCDAPHAFCNADLVFVTVPAFYMQDTAKVMSPHLKRGAKICLVPGTGGGEFAFKDAIDNGCVLFGLQRVPSVARLVEYGKTVCATGYRDELFAAAIPDSFSSECAKIIASIFDMKCSELPSYLNITLTPSNPILHTTRLKTIFGDYTDGKTYDSVPLFYEGWTDESSRLLLACDDEVQNICKALDMFNLSFVKSLKIHYESENAEQLTNKITSIKSFKGLKTPSVKTADGYAPDLNSRYFTADFSYGLEILIQIADFLNLPCPFMKSTMDWYNKIALQKNRFCFADYGINNLDDFINFYQQ
ncbi:MAG: NAD/NADP octopine/nopaline dehydrogenase family protein [Clostridia bacterium]|nr:NAD/NADP octopine/nopaline dehydrogenase family protein [Clostridia bacterium]